MHFVDFKRYGFVASLLLLLLLLLPSCVWQQQSTRSLDVMSRERVFLLDAARLNAAVSERVLFAPKGAYVVGLKADKSYGVGTWVRVFPGSDWPPEEAKPSLVIARVAERKAQWARLEILALTDGLRHYKVLSAPYVVLKGSEVPQLHAITKRLSFSQGEPGAHSLSLPLRRADGMVGSEVYGAVDIASTSGRRLASEMSALFRVSDFDETETRLERIVGQVPKAAAFVLLDAFAPPAFRVDIVVYGKMRDPQVEAVLEALQQFKREFPFLGFDYVDISRQSLEAGESLDVKLGASQSLCLELAITVDGDGFAVKDQGYRLSFSPWRWRLSDLERKDARAVARHSLAQALSMVGDNAGLVMLLERAALEAEQPETFALLAPSLVQAYQNLGRDDWGLEIALELRAYSEQSSRRVAAQVRSSLAAVASILGLSREFSQAYEQAYEARDLLDHNARRLLWKALSLGSWDDSLSWYDKANKLAQMLKKHGLWTEREEMLRCLSMRQVDEEACKKGLEESENVFERTWFASLLAAIGTEELDYATMHHLLASVDGLGAPILSQLLWARLSEGAQTVEAYELYMMNAGESAMKAQQYRSFLRWYRGIEQSRVQSGLEPYDGPGVQTAIDWLRALDRRSELAAICVSRAQSSKYSQGEAIELLDYALELYISIGDAANASLVLGLLAKHYESLGQVQKFMALQRRSVEFSSLE